MKLISLHVSNFRVIKSARIELEDAVIGIVGPNGAGKSTLVEAIAWSLYGNPAARAGKAGIKTQSAGPADPCSVELVFQSRGEQYRIIRRIIGRTDRVEVEMFRGESAESVGVRETEAYISQLLGLDYDGFKTSFLARQQELNALSDLQPARRRTQLAGMLGIDRLDRVLARIKEDNRSYSDQTGFIARRLVPEEQIDEELRKQKEKQAELADRKEKLRRRTETLTREYSRASEDLKKSQELKDRFVRGQATVEALKQTLSHLREQQEKTTAEIARLDKLKLRTNELSSRVEPFEKVRLQVKALEEARSQQQLQKTLSEQYGRLTGEEERGRREREELLERLSGFERELTKIPPDPEKVLDRAAADVRQARERYGSGRAELKQLERDRDRLRRQLSEIDRLGPDSVCDRCQRPLGDDLPRIKRHLADEIEDLEKSVSKAAENLREQSAAGQALAEREQRAQADLNRFRELNQSLKAGREDLLKLEKRIEELRRQITEVSGRLEAMPTLAFDESEYRTLQKQLDELTGYRSELDRLSGQIERLPELKQTAAELVAKRSGAEDDLVRAEESLRTLDFSPNKFEEMAETHRNLQDEFMTAREKAAAAEHEYLMAERDLESLLEKKEAQQKEREELEQCQIKLHHGEKLGNLMAAYKQHLVASIRPALADLSSRLVNEMTNGRYSLLELDEAYNLRLMDSGEYFGIERFSGGEKDLANLCLRLAISQSLTESANLDRSFIILDEVFGSQDVERRELIIDALAGLKHRFPQILLITHVDDLKQRVEQLVEVQPTGRDYSEVRVNGALI